MRTVMFVFGAGIALTIVAIITIGSSLPETHTAATRATFHAPPLEVWKVLTNVHDFPLWRSDVRTVHDLKSNDGKSRWMEDGSNGQISYERTEEHAPSRLQVRLTDDSLPFGGTWTYDLKPVNGGTELTITENGIVRNLLFRFASRYIIGYYGSQETFLNDLGRRLNETPTVARLVHLDD